VLVGRITGVGFAVGGVARTGAAPPHRFVVGEWSASPIGPFADLMWARPDGRRILVVASTAVGRFITAVYAFDEVVVDANLVIDGGRRQQRVRAADVALDLDLGRAVPFPPRPDVVTERIEAPIAHRLLGVETFGVSPSGVEELYRARRLRRVRSGTATVHGAPLLGPLPPTPAVGFGFSEPPPFPSVTEVSPRLFDPTGCLDELIDELAPAG
jgi:hypothetical protein